MSRLDNPFVVVAGPKPGVGKSMVAMAVLDWLRHAKNTRAALVDADAGNPDVFATYHQEPEPAFVSHELGKPDSWTRLLAVHLVMPRTPIVVNTGSADPAPLLACLRAIACDLAVLWVVDDDPEAPISLSAYLDAVAGTDAGARPGPSLAPIRGDGDLPDRGDQRLSGAVRDRPGPDRCDARARERNLAGEVARRGSECGRQPIPVEGRVLAHRHLRRGPQPLGPAGAMASCMPTETGPDASWRRPVNRERAD